MIFYLCKALNKNGNVVGKKIFANDNSDLFEILRSSGLVLISKSQCRSSIQKPIPEFTLPFFKNLAQLIKNKLNLIESLKIVKTLFKNDEAQLIVETITEQVRSGMSLSMALSEFDRYFDKLSIKSIEISEKTARLAESIEKIVSHLESAENMRNKIKESIRYPVILLAFILFVFFFWVLVLVPKFAELFYEIDIQPPLISRVIIKFSRGILNHIFLIGIIVCTLIFIGFRCFSLIKQRILKIPIVRKIHRDVLAFNFFTAMEMMLHDKVNLIEALECMKDIFPQISAVIESIKIGNSLTSALKQFGIINDYELSIIKAGEQSADLWPAFKSVATISRQCIESTSSRIIAVMQPVAITFMGVILMMIVYALITPLYSNLDFIG